MRLRALRPALLAAALLPVSSPAQTLVWSQDGEAQDDRFGISVSGGADLDGDGFDDVVVGSWRHDGPGGVDAGKAYAYSGQTLAQLWILD
ncbi:MAG: integrin alpha, partial [Planctomycetota bacterium]